MAKAKGAKKGKKDDCVEPEHDKAWERAVEARQWTLEPTQLPDAYTWPTWGALRERVLQACKQIKCEHTPTVRDAFAAEVVKLSPHALQHWSLKGCPNLRQVVLSPINACPSLSVLDLSDCKGLSYVLVQSMSLQKLNLSNSPELAKVIVYAPNATELVFDECPNLESVKIWSEQITELKFPGCCRIKQLQLRCEKLDRVDHPPLIEAPRQKRPEHPPLCDLIMDRYTSPLDEQVMQTEAMLKLTCDPSSVPSVYRGIGAVQVSP